MRERTYQCVQLMVTGQNQASHAKVTTCEKMLFMLWLVLFSIAVVQS